MTNQTENELTETQRDVLDFITQFIKYEGYPPSIRDIGDAFGWSSTNGVKCHLIALKKKGFIDWIENKARTIRVIKHE